MVLGLMAGVAVPKYQAALDGMELECAAKRLAADLRYAREQACTASTTLGIEFLPLVEVYQAISIGGFQIDDPEHAGQPLRVSLTSGGNRVLIVATTFPGDRAVFDFRGHSASSGSVQLTNGRSNASVHVNSAGEVYLTP